MRVRVGDFRLNVIDEGEGRPIVFLHGLGANHRSWEAQMDAFNRQFRCIAPDWRGAGDSDCPPGPYDYPTMADDLAALCRQLDISDAVFVGQSMGGSLAQVFALRHPDLVAGLVLVDTVCRNGPASREVFTQTQALVRSEGLGAVPGMFVDQVYPKPFQNERPDLVARFGRELASYDPEGLLAAMSGGVDFDLRSDLPRITAPTLVIVGDEDAICPPEESRLIASLIPGARLVVMPGCGHQPHVENTPEFNRILRRFLDGDLDGEAATSATEAEIRAAFEDLLAAARRHDHEAIVQTFATDGRMITPGAPIAIGHAALAERWRAFTAREDLTFDLSIDSIEMSRSQDLVIQTGRNVLKISNGAGQVTDESRYLFVWRRVGADWKIATDILTPGL